MKTYPFEKAVTEAIAALIKQGKPCTEDGTCVYSSGNSHCAAGWMLEVSGFPQPDPEAGIFPTFDGLTNEYANSDLTPILTEHSWVSPTLDSHQIYDFIRDFQRLHDCISDLYSFTFVDELKLKIPTLLDRHGLSYDLIPR